MASVFDSGSQREGENKAHFAHRAWLDPRAWAPLNWQFTPRQPGANGLGKLLERKKNELCRRSPQGCGMPLAARVVERNQPVAGNTQNQSKRSTLATRLTQRGNGVCVPEINFHPSAACRGAKERESGASEWVHNWVKSRGFGRAHLSLAQCDWPTDCRRGKWVRVEHFWWRLFDFLLCVERVDICNNFITWRWLHYIDAKTL